MFNLYLIRHAKAEERGTTYLDDSLRPLTNKGHMQAEALKEALVTLGIGFDKLFSSPYTRALQTAKPLNSCLKEGQQAILENLASANYPNLLSDLHNYTQESDESLALVGHEPYLSEFAAYMLTKDVQGVNLTFKKGTMAQLYGEMSAGSMTLEAMLTAKMAKAIAKSNLKEILVKWPKQKGF